MQAVFTGFDSAWSARNSCAIADLSLVEDGSLRLMGDPATVSWERAVARARQRLDVDLQVWAIDQPICVQNETGCRPVDADLARALMGEFDCGAYPANLANSCWAAGAPVWNFLRALEESGYTHKPMEIPDAKSGRQYFECYPHPALLGLFDLDRIVKYKMRHRQPDEWRRALTLMRSLATAELPIRNIGDFVKDGLAHSKRNEDKIDAIVAAYVAAYWWKFGIARSTLIGDAATGCMVTPHNERTHAALARVFQGCMNQHDGAPAARRVEAQPSGSPPLTPVSPPVTDLPKCDWVYFATPSRWSGTVTAKFVATHRVIVRNVYNSMGIRIANVRHLKPGEKILLVHGGDGRPYRALFCGRIGASSNTVRTPQHTFAAFSYIDSALDSDLSSGGYTRDPVLNRFTGITLESSIDLSHITGQIPRPEGNNTIWRWRTVFGGK